MSHTRPPSSPIAALSLMCVLAMSILGCTRTDDQRYVPASSQARDALTAYLQAWVTGDTPPSRKKGQPALQFADSLGEGRKLESFEVVGELPVEGGRRFEVQLRFRDPPGQEKAQYIVLGIDPLWVVRLEDYHMITHWDHPMPTEASPTAIESDSAGATTNE